MLIIKSILTFWYGHSSEIHWVQLSVAPVLTKICWCREMVKHSGGWKWRSKIEVGNIVWKSELETWVSWHRQIDRGGEIRDSTHMVWVSISSFQEDYCDCCWNTLDCTRIGTQIASTQEDKVLKFSVACWTILTSVGSFRCMEHTAGMPVWCRHWTCFCPIVWQTWHLFSYSQQETSPDTGHLQSHNDFLFMVLAIKMVRTNVWLMTLKQRPLCLDHQWLRKLSKKIRNKCRICLVWLVFLNCEDFCSQFKFL